MLVLVISKADHLLYRDSDEGGPLEHLPNLLGHHLAQLVVGQDVAPATGSGAPQPGGAVEVVVAGVWARVDGLVPLD